MDPRRIHLLAEADTAMEQCSAPHRVETLGGMVEVRWVAEPVSRDVPTEVAITECADEGGDPGDDPAERIERTSLVRAHHRVAG